jgi:hypothetical protein
MILRAFSGLMVALIYAALAGAFTFLCWRLTNDPTHPGAMIPDNNAWGRIIVFFMTLIAAFLGGIVAVVVSLARFDKARGALVGGTIGLVLYSIISVGLVKSIPTTRLYWTELFQGLGMYFVLFPIGLTLTGIGASVVLKKLKL